MKASNLRNILNPLDQQHLNAEYTTDSGRSQRRPAIDSSICSNSNNTIVIWFGICRTAAPLPVTRGQIHISTHTPPGHAGMGTAEASSRHQWAKHATRKPPSPAASQGHCVVGAIECTVDLKQGSAAADAKRRRDARAAQRCRDRKRMHNLKTEQELARCQRRVAQLSHELDQLRRRNKLLLDMMPPGMREDAERAASPVTTLFPDD
uniref:BZIP domain-containing protein n=1 Tax=Pyricularia oryzae (strain 70-15 / ATCC MYA-4617 / FGSC 8958) TaxID=242507 RepID=Q2KFI4_PYRO7|nr:hypothetical protein MGCH7_ch7g701 [Pyricularia oryzae 70-15]